MLQHGQEYKRPRDYHLQGTMRKTHRIEDAIIPAANGDPGTTSNAVDLRGYGLIGLILPTLTACNLTFLASDTEGGTYAPVCDALGAPLLVAAGAGNMALATEELVFLSAYRWVRVVSSVGQGAPRTLHFIVKG